MEKNKTFGYVQYQGLYKSEQFEKIYRFSEPSHTWRKRLEAYAQRWDITGLHRDVLSYCPINS